MEMEKGLGLLFIAGALISGLASPWLGGGMMAAAVAGLIYSGVFR